MRRERQEMKISKIKIKNLFGIAEQEIGGKSIELSGKNGAGKTSVIDAIRFALTNRSDRKYIIRKGENEGEIYVETDTGLTIDRKARAARGDYKSIKENGREIGSPESFLQGLFVPLQLEPMQFIQMSEKEQNAVILDMIHFDWNLETIKRWFGEIVPDVNYEQNILSVLNDIQAENGYYFQTRQNLNRDIRSKKAIIEDIGRSLPAGSDGAKWEHENIGDLYTQIERIRKNNSDIEKAKAIVEGHDQKIRGFQADKEIKLAALDKEMASEEKNIDTELATLNERIKALAEKKKGLASVKADKQKLIESEYKEAVAKYDTEVLHYADLAIREQEPVDELVAKASEVEKMKEHISEWKRMLSIIAEVQDLEEQSKELTKKIEKARNLPGEILQEATLPIEGLSIEGGIPLIKGLPISNLSEGEKLDLAVDVSIANPGGLQIILLDGTEKLSDENRNHLYAKCKAKGVQMIATRTSNDDELVVTELD